MERYIINLLHKSWKDQVNTLSSNKLNILGEKRLPDIYKYLWNPFFGIVFKNDYH